MKAKSLLMTIAILIIAMNLVAQTTGTFTDSRDGKTYKTVKIGNQTWMAENLAWKAGSGCFADENKENNVEIYGYLYTWETAMNVCPSGWHLPSVAEWSTLISYLGGSSIAGGKLKSSSIWTSPNSGATNSSGFTALPGGAYGHTQFSSGDYGFWWSSDSTAAYGYMIVSYNSKILCSDFYNKSAGFSVRCLKN